MTERLNSPPKIDILENILDTLRFRGSIFFRSRLAAPWGMALDESHLPRFHISLAGDFFVGSAERRESLQVGEMEIIVLPGGTAHWIADRPGRPLVPSAMASESCELAMPLFQSGEITNSVMCGQVHLDSGVSHPFLESLPPIIHIPRLNKASQVWQLVELIDAEAAAGLKINSAILDRLSEVLFLFLLREYAQREKGHLGFLGALRDQRIHHALKLLHHEPAKAWTIEEIAGRVGMSRANLVRRFRDQIGVAPIEYLRNWRLTKARNLIMHSNKTLESIAEFVGYSSAQTLAKAFKQEFGYSAKYARKAKITNGQKD